MTFVYWSIHQKPIRTFDDLEPCMMPADLGLSKDAGERLSGGQQAGFCLQYAADPRPIQHSRAIKGEPI